MTPGQRSSPLGCFVLPVRDRRVLLARHTYSLPDTWAMVGGMAEFGESPEAAARREAREETGLDVVVGRLVALVDRGDMLIVVFAGDAVGGVEKPQQDEIAELGWFSVKELEDLAVFDLVPKIARHALDGDGLASQTIRWPDGSAHVGYIVAQ